jgi:hypothetical protein
VAVQVAAAVVVVAVRQAAAEIAAVRAVGVTAAATAASAASLPLANVARVTVSVVRRRQVRVLPALKAAATGHHVPTKPVSAALTQPKHFFRGDRQIPLLNATNRL